MLNKTMRIQTAKFGILTVLRTFPSTSKWQERTLKKELLQTLKGLTHI